MNLKKSYAEKYGYERIITDRNSPLAFVEADMLKLAKDQQFTVTEENKEFVLIVLYGKCSVTVKGKEYVVGNRETVFDGPAESLYIGKNDSFTVKGIDKDVKICVCKAKAEKYYEPTYISKNEVKVTTFGKGACVREVAFTFPETVNANRLYIGEFWIDDGKWASYPPHKHDIENLPAEGALDEIYYYEFDKPQGFGVQMVYTKDGTINEAYKVKTGDFIEIPKGYHPFTVAPNYKNYCLWIMAGNNRGLLSSTDEDHKWMNK